MDGRVDDRRGGVGGWIGRGGRAAGIDNLWGFCISKCRQVSASVPSVGKCRQVSMSTASRNTVFSRGLIAKFPMYIR